MRLQRIKVLKRGVNTPCLYHFVIGWKVISLEHQLRPSGKKSAAREGREKTAARRVVVARRHSRYTPSVLLPSRQLVRRSERDTLLELVVVVCCPSYCPTLLISYVHSQECGVTHFTLNIQGDLEVLRDMRFRPDPLAPIVLVHKGTFLQSRPAEETARQLRPLLKV